MKRVLRLVGTALTFYAGLVAFMYLFQQNLMYHPSSERVGLEALDLDSLRPVEIPTDDGLTLRHWFSPPRDLTSPVIVYFQGNAGGLETRAVKYRDWINRGWGVFLVGYRGYGNPGTPSEEALYADSRAAIRYLDQKAIWPEGLILYGESLGTGVATQMALDFPVKALVLEAPFTSYPDVGAVYYPYLPVHWLARDRYENLSKIGRISAPLLVIHGDADKTVPFDQGKRIFEAAPEPKWFHAVPGAGHNNLYDFDAAKAVREFVEGL